MWGMAIACCQSCSSSDPLSTPDAPKEKNAVLTINVWSVDGEMPQSDLEKIYSLRLIILNDKGNMELSEYREFSEGKDKEEISVMAFPGKKKVFILANENSISEVYSESFETKPSSNLEEFFSALSSQEDCEGILNSLAFTPDYAYPLPLSSVYDIELTGGETTRATMYVVKNAVKVTFNFLNNRNEPVILNQVTLSSVARDAFVWAQVDESEQTKNGIYWVDWLKEVSENSQLYPEYDSNLDFNTTTGWISNYSVPSSQHSSVSFITDNLTWEVPAQTTIENQNPEPGELSMGPFYVAESKNIPSTSSLNQFYTLSLNIQDGDKSFNISRSLPNAKALFRNSHLDIDVNMSKGATDIYVEIKSWNQSDEVWGTLEQE